MLPADRDSGPSPLVGRVHEQSLVLAQLEAALTGQGSLVVLSGEAGIGKTTLAEVACRAAATAGALVLVGRCYDHTETPPYGPWLDLLDQAQANPQASPAPNFAHSPSQVALFRHLRDWLLALARDRPLAILLDDLHWADETSLDLLRFVARHLTTAPILLLVTYRSDEVTRQHPLYRLLPVLVREALAVRIDLAPLDTADVRALIARTYHLPDDDAGRLAASLQERAEGNPFFLGELLRALQGSALVRTAAGGWSLLSLVPIQVPVLLRQVIDARLARLGREADALLAVAAVIGQVVPLALWAAVGAADEAELLPLIERAVAARILDATPDGLSVRFAHTLIRDALYEGVLPPRRRLWHRAIGEALVAQRGTPDPDAVAYHFSQAQDPRAAAWLTRAGERAQRAFAWGTAARRFAAALALLAGDDNARNERGWLLLRLALLRRFTEPLGGAAQLVEAERLGDATSDAALVAYARYYHGMCQRMAGRNRIGNALTEEGVALLDALSPEDRARLAAIDTVGDPLDAQNGRGELVFALGETGHYAQALALGERIVALPSSETIGSRGDAHYGLGLTYAGLGRPEEARRAFAHARETFRANDHRSMVMASLFEELALIILPYQTDQPQERQRVEAELAEVFVTLDAVFDANSARTAGVISLLLAGDWDEISAILGQTDLEMQRKLIACLLAPLARHRGNDALAWQLIHESLPDGPNTPHDDTVGFILPLRALAVALALDAGDRDTARRWLDDLDHWLAWSGGVLGQADAHLGWAKYFQALGDTTQARARAQQAFAAASAPRQPLTLLAAHRLLAALDIEAGRHADAAAQLDAALTLADACEARHERALILLVLAELCHARGEFPAARAHLDAIRALCGPMGAALTLAQADTLATRLPSTPVTPAKSLPGGLTPRETEVLRLVAAGLANAEIAARLSISPHTINAHLTTIYGKLGVTSRGAAIRFALDHDLR